MGENLFILDFKSSIDQQRALCDGPRHFFKNLVLFKEPIRFQNASEVVFNDITFWVTNW